MLHALGSPLPSPLSAASAASFCATSPSAVVLTVWPSGTGHLAEVKTWLDSCGARILHASPIPLQSPLAEILAVMALYDGEEWLESNCWYMEQPLPSGPPSGPYAGAKWKRELCFKGTSREPHAIVLDVSATTESVWTAKYAIRARLARASGNPGNSCIHLTDRQDQRVLADVASGTSRRAAGGMSCDESYAYACARALLHPGSVAWLNSDASGLAARELGSPAFRAAWSRYTHWLHAPPSASVAESSDAASGVDAFDEAPEFV